MSKRSVNLLRKAMTPIMRMAGGRASTTTTTKNTTLTAADSGKVIFLDGSTTHDVTLPDAATGLNFHFILIDNTADVDVVQGSTDTEDFVGTIITGAGGNDKAAASDTKITFTSAKGENGDWVTLVCYNDDDWMVAGNCQVAAGVIFA